MKNKKYLQQKNPRKVLEPQTTADFTSRVSKSCVTFTCKFPMVMHFVTILHRRCRSKSNFYVFSYDKTSLKILCKFQIFPCSIHGEIQKNLLSELCEKRNRLTFLNIQTFAISSTSRSNCIRILLDLYFVLLMDGSVAGAKN